MMTRIIAEIMNDYLGKERLLLEKDRSCKDGSSWANNKRLIKKVVVSDCKRKNTNISTSSIYRWIAYGMVPHSQLKEFIDLFAVAENVTIFLGESIYKWIIKLRSSGIGLGNVKVRKVLFQGDNLSLSLSIIDFILLTLVFTK